jgi:pimeloyl-ACP methyl ester carboxylesterase
MAADGRVASTADGRRLAFTEWGDPAGFPVFGLHGTPNSRLARHWDETVFVEAGARLITYDRPGYGGSDRHAGRRVVDCVADVVAIADALGLDRFSVAGTSGGGPHALAVAARVPERVSRAGCTVSPAPFDAAGLDWFEGMDPLNVREIGWALEGETTLAQELEREAAAMLDRVADDPSKVLGDEWELSASDRTELSRPERGEIIRADVAESFRAGIWGWVDDDLAMIEPWGFDVAELRVPTRVIYGATDVLVPAQHGRWLAEHVPGADVVDEGEAGHLATPALVVERLRWLVAGS